MPGIGVSMTLTLKYFIHQVSILCLWEVIFVFFAIFRLGKVLWFCLTKVSGKNQSFTNLSWFCKTLQIGTKSGEKTKVARYPKDQRSQKITEYFRVEKYSILSVKRYFSNFKDCPCKILDCTDCNLAVLYFLYVCQLCTNRAFGRVKKVQILFKVQSG